MELFIEKLKIRAYHGISEQERTVGQEFEVSVMLRVDGYDLSDNLGATVNYAEVCKVITREMSITSSLIEHVAWRIGNAIASMFPAVRGGWVEVAKLHPPMPYSVQRVAVKREI